MSVVDAIAEAAAYHESPPPNEAATCLWVIYPLLRALGYAPPEIQPDGSDSNGQFPDYTILPGSPACWYLEAKAWSVQLQDNHAHQSLNYANHNGRRWVVLTNGRVWRLYDNQIQGVAADKLVTEVRLDDLAAVEGFLRAISKQAITSGTLDEYARRARLWRSLQDQIRDEQSSAIKALWASVKKEPGLSSVTRSDLVEFFRDNIPAPLTPRRPQEKPGPAPQIGPSGGQSTSSLDSGATGLGLDQLAGDPQAYVTGRKPAGITQPDGTSLTVSNWRELALAVINWLAQNASLPPLPYTGGKGGKRYLLNSAPEHKHGPMLAHGVVSVAGQQMYVDLHRSGIDLIGHVRELCETAHVDPSAFRVRLV